MTTNYFQYGDEFQESDHDFRTYGISRLEGDGVTRHGNIIEVYGDEGLRDYIAEFLLKYPYVTED